MASQTDGRQLEHNRKSTPSGSTLVVWFVSWLAVQSWKYYVNTDGQNVRL
jgi:hypothetical protein